jgi:oxygen-dependent protoporphyrinogen oxidase
MSRVVIAGGGITGLAAAWELQQQGIDYILLESADRLGGKIFTERVDGFVIEGAADSFITQKPYGWQLIDELGLRSEMIGTNDDRKGNTYILKDGKLQIIPRGVRLIVPTDPDGLLESELLSDECKQQMLAEKDVPPRSETGDESLGSFIRRRFGQEALEVFGEPLLAGIYTADPEHLSMQATFPTYLAMEQKYGSLTQGFAEAKAQPPTPGAPKTIFVSLRRGMYQLIETLQEKLTGEIRLNEGIARIEPDGTLYTTRGERLEPSAVILALPAKAISKLLGEVVPELAQELKTVQAMSSATVTFAYKEEELPRPLDGFGFVVASSEPTHLRASTWSSTKLSGRAPEGYALLRVFVGGHRGPADVTLSDEELIALARAELKKAMGIEAEPVLSRIFRWKEASTQYEVGHIERVARFEALCPPWIYLTGSAFRGVGIPDCIRQGRETAQKVAQNVAGLVS